MKALPSRPIRDHVRLDMLAVVLLLGLTGCASRHAPAVASAQQQSPKPAVTAPKTARCAFYAVTLALGLLRRNDTHLPAPAKLRDAWARMVTEAHTVDSLFADPPAKLRPLASSYKALLATIDEAATALQSGDTAHFRSLINHSGPTLASANSAALHVHFKCTIKSAGATLTFGG
jgi:hypothetical protein